VRNLGPHIEQFRDLYMSSRRLECAQHIARIEEIRMLTKFWRGNLQIFLLCVRSKLRRLDVRLERTRCGVNWGYCQR
jgi:hypothetical protein